MDPTKRFHALLQRFEVFCRDVIDPAVYPQSHPLEAAAFQCDEPVSFATAAAASYVLVRAGWEWGPVWSTCWFRIRGRVPESMAGRTVAVRFSTDTEALLWMPTPATPSTGTPLHGLDVNRDAVRLFEPARGGEPVEVFVEAACNHLFGDRGLQWDPPEIHRRWNSATPGRLDRCELAVVDEAVWRLKWVYTFALQLARELPHDSARAHELYGALRRCTNAIPDDQVAEHAAPALAELEAVVRRPAGGSATTCHAVGHAHIDTAWLWPIRETKRKCLRTFASTLRNMERFPDYRFLCSQAQQYAWLEETSPELFDQVRKRVAEGRWEPGGAMWVEPDCNVPSGESLIRQVLHADRYWREKFGDQRGRQRFLYLPDTFGFPAQLPQIMRLAGLDTFITNKLHWNDTNTFPHTTFIWRGLDGSEVIGHNTPGMDYNALLTPRELIRGERTHKNKDLPAAASPATDGGGDPSAARIGGGVAGVGGGVGGGGAGARWLQPFGFGDGGGGPTEWNILNAQLAADSHSLPRVDFSSVSEFCDALHRDVAAARDQDPASVPVHDGELYLELHRGTLTTHARIKQANAECETLLRQAEILTFAAPARQAPDDAPKTRADLDRAWKLLLLNQFHDILPGSSIAWVYRDAERDYETVRSIARPLIEAGAQRWAAAVDTSDRGARLSLGARGCDCSVETLAEPVRVDGDDTIRFDEGPLEVTHGEFRARFDRAGRITSLRSARQPDLCGDSPLNQLVLYEDRPQLWDAWDIDRDYPAKAEQVDGPANLEVDRDAGGALALRFSRRLGRRSSIVQVFRFHPAHAGAIEVATTVDWRESHRLLRVLFPTSLSPATFRAGTQFGYIDRPAAPAARANGAMFECPFQGWLSIGDPLHGGLTIACPDRYGASCDGGTLGISLVRSPRYPDPQADVGTHHIRYVVSARAATGAPFDLEPLLGPPRIVPAAGPRPTPHTRRRWTPIHTQLRLESATVDDRDRLLVRLSNPYDRPLEATVLWGLPVRTVEPVTILGEPALLDGFVHPVKDCDPDAPATSFRVGPFQVVTLAVTRGG